MHVCGLACVFRAVSWAWRRWSPWWRPLLAPQPAPSACQVTTLFACLWWSVWRWWVSLSLSLLSFIIDFNGHAHKQWDVAVFFDCTIIRRLSWCRRPWMRRGLMRLSNCVEGERLFSRVLISYNILFYNNAKLPWYTLTNSWRCLVNVSSSHINFIMHTIEFCCCVFSVQITNKLKIMIFLQEFWEQLEHLQAPCLAQARPVSGECLADINTHVHTWKRITKLKCAY